MKTTFILYWASGLRHWEIKARVERRSGVETRFLATFADVPMGRASACVSLNLMCGMCSGDYEVVIDAPRDKVAQLLLLCGDIAWLAKLLRDGLTVVGEADDART